MKNRTNYVGGVTGIAAFLLLFFAASDSSDIKRE